VHESFKIEGRQWHVIRRWQGHDRRNFCSRFIQSIIVVFMMKLLKGLIEVIRYFVSCIEAFQPL
jgi:hypothetical protein